MKQLTIAGVSFDLVKIGDDKLLFQNKEHGTKDVSIPLIGEHIAQQYQADITNIIATESELLIYVNEKNQKDFLNNLQSISLKKIKTDHAPFIVDVCFELGTDWEDVTRKAYKSKEEIIDLILLRNYPLINYGFQPGFMYLDNLDESIYIPRKEKPRLKVPSGSLAIGGKYIGIYGSESPGGWNLIGRTSHKIVKNKKFSKFPSIGQEIKFTRLDQNQYLRKWNDEA